jgi:hypothetical protein
MPGADIDTRFAVICQRRHDLQKASDARVKGIERDVDAEQKSVVPAASMARCGPASR